MEGDIASRKKSWAAITQASGEGQAAIAGTIEELNVQGLESYHEELVDEDGKTEPFQENANCQSKDIKRHSLLIEIAMIAVMIRDFENEYSLCV
jgi:hypothetical protein